MLDKFHSRLVALENAVLVSILSILILLTVGQILLRNFFSFGILGADSIMRILVLWLALFGAMAATRQQEHILIDVLTRFVPDSICRYVERGVDIISASVCGIVAYFSIILVLLEYEDGEVLIGGLPVWLCESIIPFAFAIMGLRFLFQAGVPTLWITKSLHRKC